MLTVIISKLWNFEYFSSFSWSIPSDVFTRSTPPCGISLRRQTFGGSYSLIALWSHSCPPHPSRLPALPIMLWAPQNSGSCTRSGWMPGSPCLCHGKPPHPWRLSLGPLPPVCLPPVLSADSVSFLWSSLTPCTNLLHLSLHYLWAAWRLGLCLCPCIRST